MSASKATSVPADVEMIVPAELADARASMVAAHFAPVPHAALAAPCEALIADSSGKIPGRGREKFPLA
jgi:hypothetical protein